VAEEKRASKSKPEQAADPESATSGEHVRQEPARQASFSTKSATRRALDEPRARSRRPAQPKPAAPGEEQTLRSGRAPVRMSLRMRRAAVGQAQERAERPDAGARVALRLGGRMFELPLGERAVAGRSPECQLPIVDRRCSLRHAEFSRAADGVVSVCDLGSSNGTYVNGIRIDTERRLLLGDWVTLGNETFELCLAGDVQRPATPTIPVKRRPDAGRKPSAAIEARIKTDPGSPLLSLASFAAQAASHAPSPVAPAVLEKPLRALLQQAERGEPFDPSAPEMAALVALRAASVTQEASWLSYCFQLYGALRLPLSQDLIDRLREALLCVPQPEAAPFHAYLELLAQQNAPDERCRDLIAQLNELRGCFD
jgi:hypothetical protein